MKCDCQVRPVRENDEVVDFDVEFCPLHQAAGELLEECRHFLDGFADGVYILDPTIGEIGNNAKLFLTRLNRSKAAIARAEGTRPEEG